MPLFVCSEPSLTEFSTEFSVDLSFRTNTKWQAYGGDSTMSYLTQMMALTVQNFVSAAVSMAVLVAPQAAPLRVPGTETRE
jgi:K+-transporting ATPase ATPase A chain